jgi:hypothetical protein
VNSEKMTALVKQYGDAEQFPRMVGTEGGMDYLIVAKNPEKGVQLGIKALFGQGSVEGVSAILVGFRLRAALIPGSNVTSLDEQEPQGSEYPWDVYDFPWEATGMSHTGYRGSLVRTLPLARNMNDAGFILDDLDHVRFFGKLLQFLHDKVPEEQFVVTDDDVKNYLLAAYYPAILALEAASGDPRKQLEALDLAWETKVKNHAEHQANYEKARAELLEKIAALDAAEPPTYHPKAHFGDEELISLDSVAVTMLKGTKPKLSIVDPNEGEGSDEPEKSAFESTDEPDMSAEADLASQQEAADDTHAAKIDDGDGANAGAEIEEPKPAA